MTTTPEAGTRENPWRLKTASGTSEYEMYRDPAADPFQTIDQEGIGELIKIGIERGRSVRPKLKVGICGEHGGDADSVKFCHRVGMNYGSCSPFRVPIARLAAAQAAVESSAKAKKPAAKKAGKAKKSSSKKRK
jgi:pyruvate,orthophosphate dikinase